MEFAYEAIVIGAGVMGSATAYRLAKEYGNKVLLLEQFDILHHRGSSHGESRITRMTYPQAYYTQLMPDAYKFWDEIEKEANTKLFTKTGGLDFGKETDAGLQAVIASSKKHGVPFEILNPKEVNDKFPTFNLPPGFIGVYSPDSGVLNATKCVAVLQNLAQRRGCNILDNTPISNIIKVDQPNGQHLIKVVSSTGQEFIGKKCVITSGPWTNKLLKNLEGIQLPLQPIQATAAYWKVQNPEAYSGTGSKFPVFIYYDGERNIYSTPSLEIPNMFKCAAHFGPNCDPDTRDFVPDTDTLNSYVAKFIGEMLTGVDDKPTHTLTCLYTQSPDEDFIIDRLPSSPNILIGCGFSGHGFKLAPVVGKILAELAISGVHPYSFAHKHFTLNRFAK